MRYGFITPERDNWEMELLGIMANYPEVIDKLNFDSRYFENKLHAKIFDYLKEHKVMNYEKMLLTMNEEEIKYLVNVYANNVYESSKDSMALGFARLILEEYKQDEIDKLDEKRKLDLINSDTYYVELTKIKNLSCETDVETLTDEMIDEMIADEFDGIKIKRFELLSSYLKVGVTDVLTVAATSGFGKSAFLLNIFQSLSQDNEVGYKCHYFNVEVAPKGMIKRLLAITSDKRVDQINKSNMSTKFYQEAKKKIQNDSYIESGSISLEELKAKVLNHIDEEKINVVFVDHIGLLDLNDRNYNKTEYDRITYCMKELRKLALDNNLIIFIASQFDRNSVKGDKLSMHSLKSSGEIENSSTHVMLLKPSTKRISGDKKNYEEVTIDIAKNRNGPVRELDLYTFTKTKQIFVERFE